MDLLNPPVLKVSVEYIGMIEARAVAETDQ